MASTGALVDALDHGSGPRVHATAPTEPAKIATNGI